MDTLAEMLQREEPGNIALLTSHLKADVRNKLLDTLPKEVTAAVMVQLGRVRFVEPEVLLNLKDEIERRLSGAVGGLKVLVDMVEATDFAERSEVLQSMRARDANLADQVRGKVFLVEDLAQLTGPEWSHLLSKIGHDDWATALSKGPQIVVDALQSNMPPGAWKILQQMLSSKSADPAARRAAFEKIAKAVTDLVRDGRMENPSLRQAQATPALTAPADGTAAAPAGGEAS